VNGALARLITAQDLTIVAIVAIVDAVSFPRGI
jgi:hypothetical protein